MNRSADRVIDRPLFGDENVMFSPENSLAFGRERASGEHVLSRPQRRPAAALSIARGVASPSDIVNIFPLAKSLMTARNAGILRLI